jgi:hypothetical protein
MEISGIVLIEEMNTHCIHLYREGSFWKAYEQSAYLFVKHIRNYRTKLQYYKGINREVISIGFPDIVLPDIIKDSKVTLQSDRSTTLEVEDTIVPGDFLEWKAQTPLVQPSKKGKNIDNEEAGLLTAIRLFPVANKTPIECMQFITELQKSINC